MMTNRDPRRMAWLSKALFTEAFAELPSENFVAENQANALVNPDILDLAKRIAKKKSNTKSSSSDSLSELALGESAQPQPSPSPSPSPSSSPRPPRSPASALGTASAAPSIQFKRLRFVLPVLIEVGYRGTKLGEWLVTQFKLQGYLASPWKQVREEVAWILFILTRNEFQLHENHPAQSPGGRTYEPAATLSVLSSPVYLQFVHYITVQMSLVRALYLEDQRHPAGSPKLTAMAHAAGIEEVDTLLQCQKDIAKSFIETVLTWFHATSVSSCCTRSLRMSGCCVQSTFVFDCLAHVLFFAVVLVLCAGVRRHGVHEHNVSSCLTPRLMVCASSRC
jgi:hypothetical protein